MKNDIIKNIKAILDDHDAKEHETIEKIKALIENRKYPYPDFSKLSSGTHFVYNGRWWIFLGEEQGGALCITAGVYAEMPFDKDNCNDWRKSSLQKELTNKFLTTLNEYDLLPFEMDLIADNGDKSYGKCTDLVGILNCELYRKYRDYIPLFEKRMWTCTPCNCGPDNAHSVRNVGASGNMSGLYTFSNCGVVPACIFKINNS